jgi:hypothetical protein
VGSVWDRGIAVGLRQQNPTERGIDVGLRWDQCGINMGHMDRHGSDVGLFRSASVLPIVGGTRGRGVRVQAGFGMLTGWWHG